MSQTIALVDDDRNLLTSISIALEREGFKVQTYIDGDSALIGLTRNPPDLAILDIKMPRMDGEELLKKLKKKMSIPIIFLTSKDDEVDELLGLKLGADVNILTSDNPRGEDAKKIIFEIISGMSTKPYSVQVNRKDAIEEAVAESKPGDLVVIAGRGHEEYQEIKGEKISFSDKEVLLDSIVKLTSLDKP